MSESVGDSIREEAQEAPSSWAGKAWFWAPVLPLLLLDLWSKSAVFAWLAEEQPNRIDSTRRVPYDFLPEPFGFAFVDWTNTGTIWGLGQSLTVPLMVVRTFAMGLLVWFAWRTPAARRLQLLVLGLIAAGALGNLYDNFVMEDRAVRDFLLFFYVDGDQREHHFPAFNIADSCITVGAIGLALLMIREDFRERGERRRAQEAGA